jgi:flagellar biosynthesis protein FlhA
VRRALAAEIGVVLPGVRLRDDLTRDPDTYAIRVRDELAAEGRLDLASLLAVGEDAALDRLGGETTNEPVYGFPAKWIEPAQRDRALQYGALVFDPISVIGSHVAEVARLRAEALFGRQELQTLLEHLRATVPTVVKEVGTELLPLASVHRAFALLLRERAWPRDPVAILESMIECAATSRDPRDLAEAARRCTVPALLRRKEIPQLEPLLLDPQLERELAAAGGAADPRVAMRIHEEAELYVKSVAPQRAAIVCTSAVRPLVADFLARSGLRINVYSYAEIPSELRLVPNKVVSSQA